MFFRFSGYFFTYLKLQIYVYSVLTVLYIVNEWDILISFCNLPLEMWWWIMIPQFNLSRITHFIASHNYIKPLWNKWTSVQFLHIIISSCMIRKIWKEALCVELMHNRVFNLHVYQCFLFCHSDYRVNRFSHCYTYFWYEMFWEEKYSHVFLRKNLLLYFDCRYVFNAVSSLHWA